MTVALLRGRLQVQVLPGSPENPYLAMYYDEDADPLRLRLKLSAADFSEQDGNVRTYPVQPDPRNSQFVPGTTLNDRVPA